jgi:hypothetical protein
LGAAGTKSPGHDSCADARQRCVPESGRRTILAPLHPPPRGHHG